VITPEHLRAEVLRYLAGKIAESLRGRDAFLLFGDRGARSEEEQRQIAGTMAVIADEHLEEAEALEAQPRDTLPAPEVTSDHLDTIYPAEMGT
jgi:hypothetical protein